MLNKIDMVPAEEREQRVKDFVRRLRWKGPVFQISALTREGLQPLVRAVYEHVAQFQTRRRRSPTRASSRRPEPPMTEVLRQARRIVVKVGSSLVTNEGRGVDAAGHRQLVPPARGAGRAGARSW